MERTQRLREREASLRPVLGETSLTFLSGSQTPMRHRPARAPQLFERQRSATIGLQQKTIEPGLFQGMRLPSTGRQVGRVAGAGLSTVGGSRGSKGTS